jgi:two-component system cell cycle sensor histidine kinase/response regulator CckA
MEKTTARQPLRILHLEDNPNDTEMVRAVLEDEKIPCDVHRIETQRDFEAALEQGGWQLIISDFALPSFDGLKALAVAQQKCPGTPFILFSGTIGEEMAIESLKSGATDYILKQRPARLVAAVRHALREAEECRRREQAEEELRRSEERKRQLEAQFLRVQRMESIGSLAGGVAHDLNNALVPVLVGISYLRQRSHEPDTEQMLALMESSVRRGAEMIKQVLTFARGVDGKNTIIRIDFLFREMEKIVKDIFPKSIQWKVKFPADLWSVSGSATQLHQVLMNLCINARDAMPKGGQITLSAENVSRDDKQLAIGDITPGPFILITVADTGTGMSSEVLGKIFQPFFTTKEPGKGTGLGLSTSRHIVKNHGGFITVKSELDKGTTVHVYLPAVPKSAASEAEQRRAALPTGRGELIMVVDDEAAICEITKATLENYGYRVLVAGGGPEAVAVFAENRARIKLALTDTSMPFMDGRATCLALRKLNPKLRIIVASGASEHKDEDDTALRSRVDAFIQKPYTVDNLLTTVHEVLNRKE